jgi:hypothetical protein
MYNIRPLHCFHRNCFYLFSPHVHAASVLQARVELDLRRLRQLLPPDPPETAGTLQSMRRPGYRGPFLTSLLGENSDPQG